MCETGVVILPILAMAAGLGLAIWASRRALDAASALGASVGLSPLVIGVTIVAIGTDLPEIANSVVASATGHGDVNVGNSVGSVVTQSTLVLGMLCILGGLESTRRFVTTVGGLTVLALLTGAVLFADGRFGRADGALLVAFWVVGTIVIQRPGSVGVAEVAIQAVDDGRPTRTLATLTVLFLGLVGVGSTIAVEAFTRLAEAWGMPEYLLSFFLLSLGTSMPELVVDIQALRQGQGQLALGDILGSSFIDATLAPGLGPLLFPTVLGADVARASVIVAIVVATVTVLLARDRRHGRPTGLVLILLYASLYPALIT